MRLHDVLRYRTVHRASHPAIVAGDSTWSYAELGHHIDRWCAWLHARGVQPRDRVAVMSGNHPLLAALYFVAARLDVALVFLSDLPTATANEWQAVLDDARPDWLIYDPRHETLLRELPVSPARCLSLQACPTTIEISGRRDRVPRPTRPAIRLQMYTSGTTGRPKGVCFSERSVAAAGENVRTAMAIGPTARVLLTGFLYNTTGCTIAIPTLLQGGTVIFPTFTSPREIWTQVIRDRITHLMLTPYALALAMEAPPSPAALQDVVCVAYGTAPMPAALLNTARALLPCRWLQGYGLTETCGAVTWLTEEDHRHGRAAWSCGRASRVHEVRVVDAAGAPLPTGAAGEIEIRGRTLLAGYWNAARQTIDRRRARRNDSPWLRTGDIGTLDRDGYLEITGRAKDVIVNADGHTIYPAEIERVLITHPDIIEAAVIGWQPDPVHGEVPVAVVRTRGDTLHAAEVETLCDRHLSPEKWPLLVVRSDTALPRNRSGKVLKPELRATVTPWLATAASHQDPRRIQLRTHY